MGKIKGAYGREPGGFALLHVDGHACGLVPPNLILTPTIYQKTCFNDDFEGSGIISPYGRA